MIITANHLADDNVETEMLPKHVKVISLPSEVLGGITSAEGLVRNLPHATKCA